MAVWSLAGVAEKLVVLAQSLLESGEVVKALHWLEVGLLAEPGDRLR